MSCAEVAGFSLLSDVAGLSSALPAGIVNFEFTIQDTYQGRVIDLFKVQGESSFFAGGSQFNDVFATGIYRAIGGDITGDASTLLNNFGV